LQNNTKISTFRNCNKKHFSFRYFRSTKNLHKIDQNFSEQKNFFFGFFFENFAKNCKFWVENFFFSKNLIFYLTSVSVQKSGSSVSDAVAVAASANSRLFITFLKIFQKISLYFFSVIFVVVIWLF